METTVHRTKPHNNIFHSAWMVVRQDFRAYIALNILYYGIVLAGMLYVALINPQLQETLLKSAGAAFASGPLASVSDAYTGGQVARATVLTFVVNLFLGSLIEMMLPSLVLPFFGILMGLFRAVLWGLLLSPSSPALAGAMIPHSLVLLLEGQGYILAMLAAYIHWKAVLRPNRYGVNGRWRGYLEGLRRTGWTYVLVAVVLLLAAIYEAFEVIYLAPLFV